MNRLTIPSVITSGALLLWASVAQAYVVGGPEQADHSASGSWNWDNGATTQPFRNALENPNYFGPTGVVEETIITETVDMDAADPFSGLDGFIVPWWADGQVAPYQNDIRDFFLGGGDLWLMQDSVGRDGVGDLLGVPTIGQNPRPLPAVNGTAPLFDGPFGVATNVRQGGGEEGYLSGSDVSAQNGTVVGVNSIGNVIAAFWGPNQYAAGAGALIVVADIDMFTSQATFGTELADLDDNGRFALNAFAFLSTSTDPIPTSVPEPSAVALLAIGLSLLGLRRKYNA